MTADPDGRHHLAELDGELLLAQLDELAASARPPGRRGITRLAWSEADVAARSMLAGWTAAPGVSLRTDPVGNLIAQWPGLTETAPLVMGSHLDTVVDGGHLDGAYGTVAAFNIVAALAASGERLRHPVRAVAWANEEGVVAPPFTGSRAVTGGTIDLAALGADGQTLADRLLRGGGDPERIGDAAWPSIAGYLELHIEQGPVLDSLGLPIGVVTAIAGIYRGRVVVTGRANHAGTTPMDQRRDALVAAAAMVERIAGLATQGPVDVATVGSLVVEPGNANVVPGLVSLTFDLRSVDDDCCREAIDLLRAAAARVAAETHTTITVGLPIVTQASHTHPTMRAAVTNAAASLGLASIQLASGAGHDAAHLATLGPMGMIFVPSEAGISHNETESTPPGRLVDGARTLLAALRLADEGLPI